MSRQPRLLLPGIALHVVQRGNNRNACFVGDHDYFCYLTYLRRLSAKHGCVVHAYCLMTNHVHLLLTPNAPEACTNLIRDLGRHYVPYFNRRYGRTGTLWEGRYRSCVVESGDYVLACYRYIEMNPVRAGMVAHPRAYPWSSYSANTGDAVDVVASPHVEYLALGEDVHRRRAMYLQLFDSPLGESAIAAIRDATNGSLPLASESFKLKLAAAGRKIEHARPGPRPANPQDNEDDRQLEIAP
jgi:putative transposase